MSTRIYIYTNSAHGFFFQCLLQHLLLFILFDNSHSDRCEHGCSDFIFLNQKRQSFYVCQPSVFLLWIGSYLKILPFLNGIVSYFGCWMIQFFFLYLGLSPFIRSRVCKYLLPFSSLSFCLPDRFLHSIELCSVMRWHLFLFSILLLK